MSTDKLTITLTGRAPVQIAKADWPIVAKAEGDSYSSTDQSRHQQALMQGELDEYRLTVRQHADGRAIVYGVLDAARAWTGSEWWRGGELLAPGADIAAAIERVGQDGSLPAYVIRECIADLPAEQLS